MSFPARWSDEGVAFHVLGLSGPVGNLADSDPLDTMDVHAIVVRWRDLVRLEAIEPWPRVRVRWRQERTVDEAEIGPRMSGALRMDVHRFEEGVVRLFEHVRRHAPRKVVPGWLAEEVVPWERLRAMPGDPDPVARDGAYRTAAALEPEQVVARRGAPTALETLLYWLASSPQAPWQDHPREVALTREHLYARRRDRCAYRLPLGALRTRYGSPRGHGIFVFGRSTLVILLERERCEVTAALDGILARKRGDRPPADAG